MVDFKFHREWPGHRNRGFDFAKGVDVGAMPSKENFLLAGVEADFVTALLVTRGTCPQQHRSKIRSPVENECGCDGPVFEQVSFPEGERSAVTIDGADAFVGGRPVSAVVAPTFRGAEQEILRPQLVHIFDRQRCRHIWPKDLPVTDRREGGRLSPDIVTRDLYLPGGGFPRNGGKKSTPVRG